MVYNQEDLLDIFKKMGFKSTQIGQYNCIKMSAYEAFIFSAITGATYLITDTGVTIKGRNEVFIHRSLFQNDKYIYSPGLFTRSINEEYLEENSSDILKKKYPSIFKDEKYIIIQEIKNNISSDIERKIFHDLINHKQKTENILLFKHFESGSSFEPFLEYLATKYFLDKGYLIENQVPWFQQKFSYKGKMLNGGIPDFAAFHSNISTILYKYNIIKENTGIILNMLPVLKNFDEFDFKLKKENNKNYKYELIIGEAKADKNSLEQALSQLLKYKNVELATQLYTIIPNVDNNTNMDFGEVFIKDNELILKKPHVMQIPNRIHQQKDNEWIDNYIKLLLLGNLTKKEIDILIDNFRDSKELTKLSLYKSYHLIDMVIGTTAETIIQKIKKI